ncbi:MAG TPA: hypothetical protein VFQ44_19495 [Streptosporangiaceae bacterium]|nr:hypothetical protein [Streptosporangiaceae bacterium]
MSEPSGDRRDRENGRANGSAESWERRASELADGVQRWLIKSSARTVRDEFGDQVRRAFRGKPSDPGEVWATATTEPPEALSEAPECSWCPICRAARRMAQAQAQSQEPGKGGSADMADASAAALAGARAAASQAGPVLAGTANVLFGVARDALEGLDAILSYRPGDLTADKPANGAQAGRSQHSQDQHSQDQHSQDQHSQDQPKEPEHEPDHRS